MTNKERDAYSMRRAYNHVRAAIKEMASLGEMSTTTQRIMSELSDISKQLFIINERGGME